MKDNHSKPKNFFWPSYVDLMTSLFVVMLVLFVVSFWLYSKNLEELRRRTKEAETSAARAKKIEEIANSVQGLSSEYFEFQEQYKRHRLKIDVVFDIGQHFIRDEYKSPLINAGRKIENLIDSMKAKYNDTIKYLIIIEGQASEDGEKMANFDLSYKRALALKHLWEGSNIVFDKKVCEVIIAGSGVEGVGRDLSNDKNNRRFLIQIIPKVGKVPDEAKK